MGKKKKKAQKELLKQQLRKLEVIDRIASIIASIAALILSIVAAMKT